MRIRFGALPYLNYQPIRVALERADKSFEIEWMTGPPADLARAFARGDLDASAVSAGSLPALPDARALPGACIAADGPVRSVMLFADRPLAELDGARVLHGADSVASVRLLAMLAKEMHGVAPRLEPDDAGEHRAPGFAAPVLLIGDDCMRYAARAPHGHRLDLAQAWREHTGLPMVFAVHGVHAAFARAHPAETAALASALDAAASAARRLAPTLVDGQAARLGLPAAAVADYFDRLVWSLDDRGRAGLTAYLDRLARHGFAPADFRPRFAEAGR